MDGEQRIVLSSGSWVLCAFCFIAQGIGAYNTTVEVDGEQRMVCFLDTPGHEAFSAMRARGAQVRARILFRIVPWSLYICIDACHLSATFKVLNFLIQSITFLKLTAFALLTLIYTRANTAH